MTNNVFPELDSKEWDSAHESAASHGLQGLTKALHMTVVAISNTRSQIGSQVGYLKGEIGILNKRLEDFNKSSSRLSERAVKLTVWLTIATIVSSISTLIVAIDIIYKWFS